jgi:hypothetical protein
VFAERRESGEPCFVEELRCLRGFPVDKLGAKLDWYGGVPVLPRKDSATDAAACLEKEHSPPRPLELARRYEARGSGTDYDHVSHI